MTSRCGRVPKNRQVAAIDPFDFAQGRLSIAMQYWLPDKPRGGSVNRRYLEPACSGTLWGAPPNQFNGKRFLSWHAAI